jgi:nitrate reductase assembly molybdenum cofactor insertion protein NarJ
MERTNSAVLADWRPLGLLAPLLLYPRADFPQLVATLRTELERYAPEVLETIDATLRHFVGLPSWQLEELYTQAFDLNPVCTLEVGWHLYGEQYERGRFLVRARELLQSVGLEENGELPDFLPSLLLVLPRCDASEAVDIGAYLVPALRTMCTAMDGKHEAADESGEEGAENAPLQAYLPILQAVRDALEERVPAEAVAEAEARFRPQLEGGGRTRGMEPGPNGDFPMTELHGIADRDGLVKLGVSAKSMPVDSKYQTKGVHGIPLAEIKLNSDLLNSERNGGS